MNVDAEKNKIELEHLTNYLKEFKDAKEFMGKKNMSRLISNFLKFATNPKVEKNGKIKVPLKLSNYATNRINEYYFSGDGKDKIKNFNNIVDEILKEYEFSDDNIQKNSERLSPEKGKDPLYGIGLKSNSMPEKRVQTISVLTNADENDDYLFQKHGLIISIQPKIRELFESKYEYNQDIAKYLDESRIRDIEIMLAKSVFSKIEQDISLISIEVARDLFAEKYGKEHPLVKKASVLYDVYTAVDRVKSREIRSQDLTYLINKKITDLSKLVNSPSNRDGFLLGDVVSKYCYATLRDDMGEIDFDSSATGDFKYYMNIKFKQNLPPVNTLPNKDKPINTLLDYYFRSTASINLSRYTYVSNGIFNALMMFDEKTALKALVALEDILTKASQDKTIPDETQVVSRIQAQWASELRKLLNTEDIKANYLKTIDAINNTIVDFSTIVELYERFYEKIDGRFIKKSDIKIDWKKLLDEIEKYSSTINDEKRYNKYFTISENNPANSENVAILNNIEKELQFEKRAGNEIYTIKREYKNKDVLIIEFDDYFLKKNIPQEVKNIRSGAFPLIERLCEEDEFKSADSANIFTEQLLKYGKNYLVSITYLLTILIAKMIERLSDALAQDKRELEVAIVGFMSKSVDEYDQYNIFYRIIKNVQFILNKTSSKIRVTTQFFTHYDGKMEYKIRNGIASLNSITDFKIEDNRKIDDNIIICVSRSGEDLFLSIDSTIGKKVIPFKTRHLTTANDDNKTQVAQEIQKIILEHYQKNGGVLSNLKAIFIKYLMSNPKTKAVDVLFGELKKTLKDNPETQEVSFMEFYKVDGAYKEYNHNEIKKNTTGSLNTTLNILTPDSNDCSYVFKANKEKLEMDVKSDNFGRTMDISNVFIMGNKTHLCTIKTTTYKTNKDSLSNENYNLVELFNNMMIYIHTSLSQKIVGPGKNMASKNSDRELFKISDLSTGTDEYLLENGKNRLQPCSLIMKYHLR